MLKGYWMAGLGVEGFGSDFCELKVEKNLAP
jgi:hypothetical protein